MIQTDRNQYSKVQKLPSSTSFPHSLIPHSPRPLLYKMSDLVLPHVRPDYFIKGIFSSPSSSSFPPPSLGRSLIFGLIVKCVELNECAWKRIGRRWGDSPNLFVEMEYGNEKARTETIKNTLSPVFPDKQIIVTP